MSKNPEYGVPTRSIWNFVVFSRSMIETTDPRSLGIPAHIGMMLLSQYL